VKPQSLLKRLLVPLALGLVILALSGCFVGAIGSAIRGTPPFVDQPEIHLPPQPVYPQSKRDLHLGLTEYAGGDAKDTPAAAAPGDSHGATEPAKSEAPKGAEAEYGAAEAKPHATPLGMTEFAVTNTMLAAWLGTLVIILFFVLGTRRRSLVPGRFQGLVETLVEGVLGFATGVVGPEMARKALPVVGTIFFFVLFNALLALFPFYQFLGFVEVGGHEIKAHLLRSPGTDVNMPMALALVSFAFVEYWGLRAHGFAYMKKFFPLGKLLKGNILGGLIDLFVGFLELVSELVRVVSFTFRLFGNMTAGEILVVMVTFLAPFVFIQIFFALELLVALIQSVIFAGLTLVFLSVAVRHEEHH
jgi:F-type H+-transporting ATPase subunit a